MNKFYVSLLLLCLTATCALFQPATGLSRKRLAEYDRRQPFALELPDIGVGQITAPEATIPTSNLSRLRFRIRKPYADSINYGKIYTTINGEAAGTIQNVNSDNDGYVVTCNLESKLRFRLQPGKNVVEIYAVDQERREYYASYVLIAGGAGSTVTANGAVNETVPVERGIDREPPVIRLQQPVGAVQLMSDSGVVKVLGEASDNSCQPVSIKINGQQVTTRAADKCKLAFEQSVAMTAGVSGILIEARDAAGNLTRLTISVHRREAAISAQFKGRKFALIVGVSHYKFHDGGLKDLAYADVDARTVRDFLQRREGGSFAASDILYLENETATIAAMRSALQQFLAKAGTGDLIFLYLAGHGTPDPYAPQTLYFLLHDTKVADMPNTALPMRELQESLDYNIRAKRVVVFIDACHSAGLSGEQLVETRGLENNLINLYAAKLFNEEGRAVMTSSDVNEVSRESQRWGGGHGIFTWALLEGLGGRADANADHLVTAGELFSFVRERVRSETEFRQNPRIMPGANADLPLAVAAR
jgi:hypothetical protein